MTSLIPTSTITKMAIPRINSPSKGDPLTAKDGQSIARAINSLAKQSDQQFSSHGAVYYKRHEFEPTAPYPSDGDWKVTLTPGYLLETNIKLDPPMKTWTPQVNGEDMTADPVPELTVAAGDEVWLIFDTDPQGQITGAPEIKVDDGTGQSHHVPIHPQGGGEDGKYKIKLFEILDVGGALLIDKLEVKSNITWQNQLIKNFNVGGEAELYKEFNKTENKHDWRTLKQETPLVPPSEWETGIVNVSITQQADTIDITSEVFHPPIPAVTGATGTITFTDEGSPVTVLNYENGLVKAENGDFNIEISSGVPAGYVETAASLCIAGVVTPGKVLFKPDA